MVAPQPYQGASAIASRALDLLHQQEQAEQHALDLAIACGQELAALKGSLGHGRWLGWLHDHWPRSVDVAEEFMLLARPEHAAIVQTLDSGTGRRAAAAAIREHVRKSKAARPWLVPIVRDDPIERWTAELGDARHLPFADGTVQLIVTSPPYNCGTLYEGYDDWLQFEDYWRGLIEPALRECYRVLAPGGRLALNMPNVVRQEWPVEGRSGRPTQYQSRPGRQQRKVPGAGGDSWALMIGPRLWTLLEGIGFLPREQITWCKADQPQHVTTTSTAWGTFCSPSNPVLRAVSEPVFLASKDSHSREAGPSDLTPEEFKEWTRNVWFIPNDVGLHARVDHPCPFPVALPHRIIKLYSYPGDLVVDPFMGTAAAGEAAVRTGRRFYGADISEQYVLRARARLAGVERGA